MNGRVRARTTPMSEPTLGGPAQLPVDRLTVSTRDQAELGARICSWLSTKLDGGTDLTVTDIVKPQGNGMSSDTLLFTARWTHDGEPHEARYVARIEPELDKVPVFPTYDLEMQFRVMSLVGDATDVAVPAALWFEEDAEVIGAPFFVMARVDGEVPRDVLPYTFPDPNWVLDATPEQRSRMQRSAVASLAGVHDITPETHDLDFLTYPEAGPTALDVHLAHWETYLEWVTESERSPLLDECFAWLRDNQPTDVGDARLSWGDARIGNMLFADYEVAGVLDWEMAGIAPPEVDLGWMAYLHCFFQDLTTDLGAEGLPDFMHPDDLAATYREVSGLDIGDLQWSMAYAAMRHGVIMRRVTERAVLFGEAIRPPDIDDMIIHRSTLRQMLDGSYWDRLSR